MYQGQELARKQMPHYETTPESRPLQGGQCGKTCLTVSPNMGHFFQKSVSTSFFFTFRSQNKSSSWVHKQYNRNAFHS